MTEFTDCSSVLHMTLTVTGDACAGARAAIRAGEILAKATKHAGLLGFWAGVLTLVGGLSAVGVTVWIATIEARKTKRRENALTLAYHRHLVSICGTVPNELTYSYETAKKFFGVRYPRDFSRSFEETDKLLNEISPHNWKELSNVVDLLTLIIDMYGKVRIARSRIISFSELTKALRIDDTHDPLVEAHKETMDKAVTAACSTIIEFVNLDLKERQSFAQKIVSKLKPN